MTRRRIHTLIWCLLPLFALRGMVPAGFMVNLSGGDLSMTVCPMHQSADAGRADGGHTDAGQHKKTASSVCPFAAALTSATFIGIAVPAFAFVVTESIDVGDVASRYIPFGPSRAQQSRAPPYFS